MFLGLVVVFKMLILNLRFFILDVFFLLLKIISRVAGIEPTRMVLKTRVLPLNYTPNPIKLSFIGLIPIIVIFLKNIN